MKTQALVLGLVVAFGATACGSDTRVAIKNANEKDSKVKVRDSGNTSSSEADFGEVAAGATSGCKTLEYDGYDNVQVNATDNAENGSVNLSEGEDNLITIYEDGTEPTAKVVDGLCD